MKKNIQVFYAFFSGIMLSFGIANEVLPFGSPILGLFALVPFYLAVRNAKNFHESGLLTAIQVITVHLCSSFWLGFFRNFAIFTLGASAVAYGFWAYCVGMCIHLAFYHPKHRSIIDLQEFSATTGSHVLRRIFLFCAFWTVWEWNKSIGFLAYPWGTVLMTAYRWPLISQIVDFTGTWGISFLFALFSAVFAEGLALLPKVFMQKKNIVLAAYSRIAAFCFFLFMLTVLYGIFQYTKSRTPLAIMDTVIVQHNGDSWNNGANKSILVAQDYTKKAIMRAGKQPDLVVWSESVLNIPFPYAKDSYDTMPFESPLFPFIRSMQVPFIIGGPVISDIENEVFHNSANYFNKNGEWIDYYGKMQLVPFAEVIPFAESKIVQTVLKTLVGFSRGWTPGKEFKLFDIPLKTGETIAVSAPICFEDAFPAVCRGLYTQGSQVFVNITNDSWSRTNSAEYQHFVIASFRPIEFRTTMIRATNSGYSVVVDPTGKILADMPLFTEDSIFTQVPVYQTVKTFYFQFGDWFPLLLLCLAFTVALAGKYKKQ